MAITEITMKTMMIMITMFDSVYAAITLLELLRDENINLLW